MNVRYQVELSQAERVELKARFSGGKHASRKLKRAQILLTADAGRRRRGDRQKRRRARLDRVPGAGAERGGASRGGAQTRWWRQPPPAPQKAVPTGRSSCWQVRWKWAAPIPSLPKSHNHCAEVLVGIARPQHLYWGSQ